MSGRHLKKIIFTFAFIFVTSISLIAQSNQSPANPPADTIFSNMYLSDDGIAAVDTLGNDWYYDFELDMFVSGLLQRSITNQRENNDFEPVETRCIVEKNVKPSTTKSIIVGVDEVVNHDIIVLGRVTVKGWVKGNITSYNNKVIVKSTGRVDGDIYAPSIKIHDDAIVLGEVDENSLDFTPEFQADGFFVIMIIMSSLCVILFMIIALMPKKLEVVSDCFKKYNLRSTLLGFLFLTIGIPILMGLLVITIIGIPVALLGVPLAYLLAMIFGIAAFSNVLGNLVFGRFLSSGKKVFMKIFLGFSLFALSWIIGISFMNDPQNSDLGIFFFVISILMSIVPLFGGIGACVLTRFGTRPYMSWKERIKHHPQSMTPAPPPMPQAPDIKPPPKRPSNNS